jgi:uncharacterized protein (DUF169 family)
MDCARQESGIMDLLGLRWPPVAVTFTESPPPGVDRIARAAPASCAYWRLAAEGRVFYTLAADHFNCPVGAHTHGVDLPPDRAAELESVLRLMLGLGYLGEDEIPAIPRREGPFGAAVFAPLGRTPAPPDVVLVRGNARQIMLLAEAARAAGIGRGGELLGRPTCAALPAVMRSGGASPSLGCIGNRVYTGLGDDELYLALPGPRLAEVLDRLKAIVGANRALESHHQKRRGQLS